MKALTIACCVGMVQALVACEDEKADSVELDGDNVEIQAGKTRISTKNGKTAVKVGDKVELKSQKQKTEVAVKDKKGNTNTTVKADSKGETKVKTGNVEIDSKKVKVGGMKIDLN